MRIISRKTITDFTQKYPQDSGAFYAWFHDVKNASWENWAELKKAYPTASPVGNDRYVFNIKGNHYRIIVLIKFQAQIVYIRFVGTHTEYDKINAREV